MRFRTAWIHQWAALDREYDVAEEYDRFRCSWQWKAPDGLRLRYGPACVALGDALAWAEGERCERAVVVGFGDRNWVHGRPDPPFEPLPEDAVARADMAASWEQASIQMWEVAVSLALGARDYEDAAAGFEAALRATCAVLEAACDRTGLELTAVVAVGAPGQPEAQRLAGALVQAAATTASDGLRDERGDALHTTTAVVAAPLDRRRG